MAIFEQSLQTPLNDSLAAVFANRSGMKIVVGCVSLSACWSTCPSVERKPETVSGAWVFRGTRVPVQALFANLEDGARIDDFLEWFPGVTRAQVEAVLRHAEQSLAVA